MNIFLDHKGKLSSKRILGILAGLSLIAIAFISVFGNIDAALAATVMAPLAGFSAACLGFTLKEGE